MAGSKTQENGQLLQKKMLLVELAPDEAANTVLFLASDEASFITGATLSVDDGGLLS